MSQRFNGFTQDEIKRVSGSKQKIALGTSKPLVLRGGIGIRRMPERNETIRRDQQQIVQRAYNKQKQKNKNDAANPNFIASNINEESQCEYKMNTKHVNMMDLELDSTMSKSIEEALFYGRKTLNPTNTKPDAKLRTLIKNEQNNNTMHIKNNSMPNSPSAESSSILKLSSIDSETSTIDDGDDCSSILPSTNVQTEADSVIESPFKGISLKDFEAHRKMVEEQNREKKQLLYRAIEHYSQKTAAEARKIDEIRNELAKLDNDMAVDVALLRKQIDTACIHFAHIEKQYMKIEAQFLKAKMELHSAAEKKELLTEHLCTVIAHNEDRKAQKLSELMYKVGLNSNGLNEHYVAPTLTNKINESEN